MKLNLKKLRFWKKVFLFSFIFLFSTHFIYQRIVDNEVNCGLIGIPESGCPYAFLDHAFGLNPGHDLQEDGEHTDHVCFSCPCNLIMSCSWDLHLSHVLIQLHKIYIKQPDILIPKLVTLNNFFRPPKQNLS
ncbi:hypothetical protein ND861_00835 [Leptospira sp. 2 VSF19]|uniref:DUF2946 domain-containing protein n=1 Tax=Leptospira soteropolitanensis TaxID=2950025 RepID=A0AAW5VGT0_9LEPT|nr:hypothetical protein [Leptospira soteropolitanensis]MCW7491188.1 hypothetical protein [Leptospira soteropolitanensis]MCW7498772.1 hypothetical protein [Leptospira soteropolitanensis]MCW7521635.1 hypothetical protein [Leptospira soteropolitanensis]MCW7524876.1 hypothetical protein [Leptospira soteropolitanensis]MCW7528743.1 hypothetical protein [Leptospira soteropolitanensis]